MAEKKKEYTLKDFIIRDLNKAEGVNDTSGKAWIRFKFKTTDPQAKDREFTYFPYGLTKPETWPYDGAEVTTMTFTITEEGQYKGDCNVKKILYDQASKPPPVEGDPFAPSGEMPEKAPSEAPSPAPSQEITKDQSVCISYVKDMAIARLAWVNHDKIQPLAEMANDVATVGAQFYRDVINNLERMKK